MAIVKTNVPGLVIDTEQNLVINTNDKELQSYRAQVHQSKEISSLREELDALKAMMIAAMRK